MKDFDKDKILQRPFFQDLNLPNCSDDEILATFDVSTLKDSAAMEKRIADLYKLDDRLKEYRRLVKENISDFKQKIALSTKIGAINENDAARLRQLNFIADASEVLNLKFGQYYVNGKKAFDTQYRKEFGQRLKAARLELSLSQGDVGRKIGLSRNAYQTYELGQRDPSIATIRHLTKILKKDANFFFGN